MCAMGDFYVKFSVAEYAEYPVKGCCRMRKGGGRKGDKRANMSLVGVVLILKRGRALNKPRSIDKVRPDPKRVRLMNKCILASTTENKGPWLPAI